MLDLKIKSSNLSSRSVIIVRVIVVSSTFHRRSIVVAAIPVFAGGGGSEPFLAPCGDDGHFLEILSEEFDQTGGVLLDLGWFVRKLRRVWRIFKVLEKVGVAETVV